MKFTEVNPISIKIQKLINKSILNTIKKKDFILGKNVNKFEKKFSQLTNSKFAIGCATGTDALTLALKVLNLKSRDEIIIPGMSYISTGLSVILNNYKLKFADINKDTGLICLKSIKKNLTNRTKVIIPVNLYGQKVDIRSLRQIVGKKIFIIEDSAQSHFSSSCKNCKRNNHLNCYKSEKSHKYADLSCFSFYPSKNLGAYGDGGIITTDNKFFYTKLLALRNLGSIKKNVHQLEGLNSRLDTIQASILLEKIKYAPLHNNYRRKISSYYDRKLSSIKDVKLTLTDPGSSRHLYVIRVKKREKLVDFLKKNKISVQFHYPYSLNKTGALKNKIKKINLKNSEIWAKECLSLPLYPFMKISDANKVVSKIKKFYS